MAVTNSGALDFWPAREGGRRPDSVGHVWHKMMSLSFTVVLVFSPESLQFSPVILNSLIWVLFMEETHVPISSRLIFTLLAMELRAAHLFMHRVTQIYFQNQVVFFHFALHFIIGCLCEPLDGKKIGFHFTEKKDSHGVLSCIFKVSSTRPKAKGVVCKSSSRNPI